MKSVAHDRTLPCPYPKLMISKVNKSIWLIINRNAGMCIQLGDAKSHQIGDTYHDLSLDNFETYHGVVTISNE